MRILVEGHKYSISALSKIFNDHFFYNQYGTYGIINQVGYYYSFPDNQLVYVLPKVFVDKGFIFNRYTPEDLLKDDLILSINHSANFAWLRQFLIIFYKSLIEYKKRHYKTSLLDSSQGFSLITNLGFTEYSYLDLVLSFVSYYKKNKNIILFRHIEQKSNQVKKILWEKSIRSSLPIINSSNVPVYLNMVNKKRIVNNEELLFCYFFSILNYFNNFHSLNLSIDKSFTIISGRKFESLQQNGLSKLRRIKHKYFSDSLKRMYQLCELYFSLTDRSSIKNRTDEYVSVKNYNLVFEDMVDKLFSDYIESDSLVDGLNISDLKLNEDGKIIDHLYEYQSLVDSSRIFYIGDSKYYSPETEAGRISSYKQFTYAKNIIQFNISLFNESAHCYSTNMWYRDNLTEGYNITPNFFIYGYIHNLLSFDDPALEPYKEPKTSFHFYNRLFDRDTLFVHQYRMNFLFIVKSYSTLLKRQLQLFRTETRSKFRDQFITYFNSVDKCGFELFEKDFLVTEMEEFVHVNFRQLNGKCIHINNTLIIAKHKHDTTLDPLLVGFTRKIL